MRVNCNTCILLLCAIWMSCVSIVIPAFSPLVTTCYLECLACQLWYLHSPLIHLALLRVNCDTWCIIYLPFQLGQQKSQSVTIYATFCDLFGHFSPLYVKDLGSEERFWFMAKQVIQLRVNCDTFGWAVCFFTTLTIIFTTHHSYSTSTNSAILATKSITQLNSVLKFNFLDCLRLYLIQESQA